MPQHAPNRPGPILRARVRARPTTSDRLLLRWVFPVLVGVLVLSLASGKAAALRVPDALSITPQTQSPADRATFEGALPRKHPPGARGERDSRSRRDDPRRRSPGVRRGNRAPGRASGPAPPASFSAGTALADSSSADRKTGEVAADSPTGQAPHAADLELHPRLDHVLHDEHRVDAREQPLRARRQRHRRGRGDADDRPGRDRQVQRQCPADVRERNPERARHGDEPHRLHLLPRRLGRRRHERGRLCDNGRARPVVRDQRQRLRLAVRLHRHPLRRLRLRPGLRAGLHLRQRPLGDARSRDDHEQPAVRRRRRRARLRHDHQLEPLQQQLRALRRQRDRERRSHDDRQQQLPRRLVQPAGDNAHPAGLDDHQQRRHRQHELRDRHLRQRRLPARLDADGDRRQHLRQQLERPAVLHRRLSELQERRRQLARQLLGRRRLLLVRQRKLLRQLALLVRASGLPLEQRQRPRRAAAATRSAAPGAATTTSSSAIATSTRPSSTAVRTCPGAKRSARRTARTRPRTLPTR
jgi:hypothetical protein